ncbi:MAG: hypothetical protein ACFB9M_10470 [Myxococcota bacterium]
MNHPNSNHPNHHNHLDRIRSDLTPLAEDLIERLVTAGIGIREGVVMTPGEPPYRRLDCDSRALCYIRVRPKKRAVRVDVSGLWNLRGGIRLTIPGSTGMASLMLRTEEDVLETTRYLVEVVVYTRRQYEAEAQRGAA